MRACPADFNTVKVCNTRNLIILIVYQRNVHFALLVALAFDSVFPLISKIELLYISIQKDVSTLFGVYGSVGGVCDQLILLIINIYIDRAGNLDGLSLRIFILQEVCIINCVVQIVIRILVQTLLPCFDPVAGIISEQLWVLTSQLVQPRGINGKMRLIYCVAHCLNRL